jgi:hypothetical protein|nr:hypothetical protein Q903MT_gene5869 [Picea sitchensis]
MVGPIQGLRVTKRKDESQPLDAWWNDEGVNLWTVWDTTSGSRRSLEGKPKESLRKRWDKQTIALVEVYECEVYS